MVYDLQIVKQREQAVKTHSCRVSVCFMGIIGLQIVKQRKNQISLEYLRES